MPKDATLTRTPLMLRSSAIREMTLRSQAVGAVNLSQGFPDTDPPPEILALFKRSIAVNGVHQYSESRGVATLRHAISKKLAISNGIEMDPDYNIIVTCGATEAMIVAFRALFQPGDQIIAFAPLYENYLLQAIATGLKLVTIPLSEPEFSISTAQLEAAFTTDVKGILICNPCNPTGKVLSQRELSILSEFSCEHDLVILSDETYEQFIWKGKHISIASLPNARSRTVTIMSLGKTYSVTGWRVGYIAAADKCASQIAAIHDFTTVSAPHPCQVALAAALNELPQSFYQRMWHEYDTRKRLLMAALIEVGFSPVDPDGAYFLWCDYSRLSEEPDDEFARRLLDTGGVAGVPGSVFYPTGAGSRRRIRFTFSKSQATINAAIKRLTVSKTSLLCRGTA